MIDTLEKCIPIESQVLPSCSLRSIGTNEQLAARNLILADVNCRNVTGVSDSCLSGESAITYRCRNGFKFETNEGNKKNIMIRYNLWNCNLIYSFRCV